MIIHRFLEVYGAKQTNLKMSPSHQLLVFILHQRDGDVPIDRMNSADCSKILVDIVF